MNEGKTVFSQLIGFLPDREFRRCVARYGGDRYTKTLSCWEQFLAMAFAQLAYRESLRDIEACLGAIGPKLYHMGFSSSVARSTLADANESRDWRIFADFVVRTKTNVLLQRRYSRPVDKSTGLRSDHTVILTSLASATAYPDALRRVTYCDPETGKRLKFLTNNFTLPALAIAEIYKKRWAVELFFRWIKQHLRIKAFYGTSENAVKTQIWIAVSVYILVAIVRKRLGTEARLYQLLQIFSLTLFEKTPILQVLQRFTPQYELQDSSNQLILFNF